MANYLEDKRSIATSSAQLLRLVAITCRLRWRCCCLHIGQMHKYRRSRLTARLESVRAEG